ncbi:hypothetical protein B6I21_05205 [candidate division KSB1 bacterium 4572_119]|nr:MAG: hypothetical protein B6I21_05205 [candidate division KSB1 bacterium 4572_119]
MSLDLIRIDDRLVHGQVVITWGAFINATKIILCNNEIAQSEAEKDLYMNAEEIAPHPLKICVWTREETLTAITENELENDKTILLLESPKDLLQLVDDGLNIKKANVGGMHYQHGKRQLTSYIYVDDEDVSCLKKLHQLGIHLEGKDVPSAKSFNISEAM